ncbi:MAG: HAD-IA family hydrolase [Cellulomonas sp.]
MSPALVFDCDGVLADTERDGHLPAFNQTFADAGLPIHWSEEEYGELLAIGGGKERLATVFTPLFVEAAHLPTDPEEQKELIARWHKAKTAHYTAMVADGVMPGRPGIARIVAAANAAGWRLAVASTSAEASVRAVLEHAVGADLAAQFAVFAGDVVPAKKPAPDIYLLALREMGLGPADVVVVEDSANGLRAALGAGLRTVVTVSSYTAGEDFTGASLVVSSLGDLPDAPADVLANPHGLSIDGQVELSHFANLLQTP